MRDIRLICDTHTCLNHVVEASFSIVGLLTDSGMAELWHYIQHNIRKFSAVSYNVATPRN